MRVELGIEIALLVLTLGVGMCWAAGEPQEGLPPLRPPAVPLVACDPYFSIWSCADRLTDDATRHWTHRKHALTSLIRVDGTAFRLMGDEPKSVPPLPQVGLLVLPTRTIYDFENPQVHVTLTFMTPSLPEDLDVLARPLTYLTWDVRSRDGQEHAVSVYFSDSAELTVNAPEQKVAWSRERVGDLIALRIGSQDQPVLQKRGDDLRIDWGYAYAAAPQQGAVAVNGSDKVCTDAFVAKGELPASDDARMPRAVNDALPVSAFVFDLGRVAKEPVSRFLMLAYDDEFSINYFGQKLRPYWRRSGAQAADLLQAAARDYPSLQKRCEAFDRELVADLTKIGGERYARLCALAYRQCLAGNKLCADAAGQPLLFPKENTSNGCIATVDVIYPMAPMLLLLSPTLARASMVTVLSYAASDRWRFPFAPHDLGCYPRATAQVYGGGERTEENQMPVEESGNMILLLAAIARIDGNADLASRYWPVVTRWAEYLEARGFDPSNQLCTDDFAGHLAHNTNLSLKAILALAAYAQLCEMRGDRDAAAKYRKLAQDMATRWVQAAADGDHYRLTFDRPGTWSQKYNLVWDRILGLNLFPPDVARRELAHYRRVATRFGVPLDSRQKYTKLDWLIWSASLAETQADFEALANATYDFIQQVPDRNPMTDWYMTDTGRERGMHARPVIGGVFIRMLTDPAMWSKWAKRDKTPVGNWAPLPTPPQTREVVPTAQKAPVAWRYTFEKPADDWFRPDFKAEGWKEGPAGFGTAATPGAVVRTQWNTTDIWIRREFTMPEGNFPGLQLLVHHDEDADIYLNGVLAARLPGFVADYEPAEIAAAARAALKPGRNTIAVHCHQTTGGQYMDVGLAEVH